MPIPMRLHYRLLYLPDIKLFELKFDNKRWKIKPSEVEDIILHAQKQLMDATDATTEFTLKCPTVDINLVGVTSKDIFAQVLNYLVKVWESYKQYEKLA